MLSLQWTCMMLTRGGHPVWQHPHVTTWKKCPVTLSTSSVDQHQTCYIAPSLQSTHSFYEMGLNTIWPWTMKWRLTNLACNPFSPHPWAHTDKATERLTAITLTNVVFPEYWSPTSVSSISSFQNRDLNQSRSLLIRASILEWHLWSKSRRLSDLTWVVKFVASKPQRK